MSGLKVKPSKGCDQYQQHMRMHYSIRRGDGGSGGMHTRRGEEGCRGGEEGRRGMGGGEERRDAEEERRGWRQRRRGEEGCRGGEEKSDGGMEGCRGGEERREMGGWRGEERYRGGEEGCRVGDERRDTEEERRGRKECIERKKRRKHYSWRVELWKDADI